jgi:DNA-binding NtrC family response regulator
MSSKETTLLVADDQADVRETLRLTLKTAGYPVATAGSPAEVLSVLQRQRCAALIMDMNYSRDTTSGTEGLQLLKQVRELEPDLPIVVITAWSNTDLVVQAMQNGAADFIEKPWDNQRLLNIVAHLVALGEQQRSTQSLEAENRILRGTAAAPGFVAKSSRMKELLELVEDIAGADANILITGENGTGKSELARLIHERSHRAEQRFVRVNIGALPESLFESELFGHVKGAFTDARDNRVGRFELSNQGTLFLDEIANIPLLQQNRLLHVLECGEFQRVGSSHTQHSDARIISATNADLDGLMEQGDFRRDLYFRLNTVQLELPPLRQRREDIMPLAELFLSRYKEKYRRQISSFDKQSIEALEAYAWPGNVRELMNVVERACLVSRTTQITAPCLALDLSPTTQSATRGIVTIEELEKALIERTLEHFDNNVSQSADSLGISRGALYRRMDEYHIARSGD